MKYRRQYVQGLSSSVLRSHRRQYVQGHPRPRPPPTDCALVKSNPYQLQSYTIDHIILPEEATEAKNVATGVECLT